MLAKLKIFEVVWLLLFGLSTCTFLYIFLQKDFSNAANWLLLMAVSAFFYFRRRKIRKELNEQ
jgi:hypothetical protein